MSPAFVGLDGAALSGVNLAPDAWEPNLSPDGQWIVYVTRSTDVGSCGGCADAPRLAVVRVDGTGSHFLDLHGVSIDDVSQPVWSPDGTMIAFVQGDGAYYSGNIAVIDTGGTRSSGSSLGGVDRVHVIHLTSGPTQKSWPSWSPDGSSIIYNDSGSTPLDDSGFSATQEIYSVAADGTGSPVRITHNQVDDSEAVYSPDGSKMALFHGGGVVIMNADGSNIRPTKSGGGFSPRWSPDGSKIAFFTYSDVERYILPNPRTGRPYSWPRLDIKILTIATGGIANVGVSVASDLNAVSWASDGQSLFVNRASNPSG